MSDRDFSYMEFAHRYNIKNMERKMDVQDIHLHGSSMKYMGANGDSVSMTIPMYELERLARNDQMFHSLIAQTHEEETIREDCPAVDAAYHQYRMLLSLAK